MTSKIDLVKERIALLRIISGLSLSPATEEKIAQHIGKFQEAEKETAAKQMQELLNNSKTEAEILEKLNRL